MTDGTSLGSVVAYSGTASPVRWEGRVVDDRERFGRYVRDVVRPRIADEASSFDAELRGLATTGMETRLVERLLRAVPGPESWEIGEAFAECALRDESDREVHWPWNTVRDRRTPRASLPGADLVGFCCDGQGVFLLFGEVKTSSDARTPPGVMSGGSGMAWQLERSAARLDVQHTWCEPGCGARTWTLGKSLSAAGAQAATGSGRGGVRNSVFGLPGSGLFGPVGCLAL